MKDQIVVKYQDITIAYDEKDDRWCFELRGRHRSAESLQKAKEFIDRPVQEKEEKTFKRTPVFYNKYGQGYLEGDATSVAERRYGSGNTFWVVSGKERSKVSDFDCFPRTEQNIAIVNQWRELDGQAKAIREQQEKLRQKLTKLEA